MLRYALSSGKELPQQVMEGLDSIDRQLEMAAGLTLLAELHGALVRVVAPATPAGLALIAPIRTRGSWTQKFSDSRQAYPP